MSIETYEHLTGKFELYKLLDEGVDAMNQRKVRTFCEALADIQKGLKKSKYNIEITEIAENDLCEIGNYIVKGNSG